MNIISDVRCVCVCVFSTHVILHLWVSIKLILDWIVNVIKGVHRPRDWKGSSGPSTRKIGCCTCTYVLFGEISTVLNIQTMSHRHCTIMVGIVYSKITGFIKIVCMFLSDILGIRSFHFTEYTIILNVSYHFMI